MENFMMAVSVVLPLIVYMSVGRLIRNMGILKPDHLKAVNAMLFRIFIPLALFFNVYDAEFSEAFQADVFAFALIGVLAVFVVLWLVVSKCVRDDRNASTIIQGTYRSNFVLFGATVAASLCDKDGVALVATLAAVVVPVFNMLAVILFEVKGGRKVRAGEIILNICKNPLVDAGVLGCIFSAFQLKLPSLIAQPLASLGEAATPLALVILGAMLSFESAVRHRKYLIAATVGRLVLVPLPVLVLAVWMGMRGNALIALVAVFASPTAVASVPMAQMMGGNEMLAGEIVTSTTVCSILTIFLFVFGLSGMGFI